MEDLLLLPQLFKYFSKFVFENLKNLRLKKEAKLSYKLEKMWIKVTRIFRKK